MKRFFSRYADILVAAGVTLLFLVWPQLDLELAAQFYEPGRGFPATEKWWIQVTYIVLAKFGVFAIICAILLVFGFVPRLKTRWAARRTALLYLLAVLVIGPGLLVNTVLKENWGRPRPVHLEQFGGNAHFVPAFVPSKQCARNCSFVSGHAAAGFYPMVGFWLTRRRRWLVGGTAFGLFVGFTRMAMGGHFLSDVLIAGLIVYFTCRALAAAFRLDRTTGARTAGMPAPQAPTPPLQS